MVEIGLILANPFNLYRKCFSKLLVETNKDFKLLDFSYESAIIILAIYEQTSKYLQEGGG